MVEILKITSPIGIKNKIENIPKQPPSDVVFDIKGSEDLKIPTKIEGEKEGNTQQTLLNNLSKEIFLPLMNDTKAQSESVRKIVLMARLFEVSSGIITEDFLDQLFIRPTELLDELLEKEKGSTIFKGDFFDSLRVLVKLEGQPKLLEAVTSILKYYDCYVNQDNSLKAIMRQSQLLATKIPMGDAEILLQKLDQLEILVALDKEERAQVVKFLNNELIPTLGKIVTNHNNSDKTYNQVMAIIHNIVRYDKADPKRLEESVFHLGEELKPLTKLIDEDILEMKTLLFDHGKKAREQKGGGPIQSDKNAMEKLELEREKTDIATLLSKALDKSGPNKINNVAQSLLLYMVQSESPILPLMHYMIPFRYLEENTFGEFFIDKDCDERKGNAEQAKNIFFTIQSDKYGTFEVDLLARDQHIDLDIKCPDNLLTSMGSYKAQIKEIIEEQGYRLANYKVAVFTQSQTIMKRFPKAGFRKVGIDVKI